MKMTNAATTGKRPLRDLLHEATHRVPGVPAHVEHPPGHQGGNRNHSHNHNHNRGAQPHRPVAAHDHGHAHGSGLNHSSARQPRVFVAWQKRIAAFFGQEL
jgi:hypothetical protein